MEEIWKPIKIEKDGKILDFSGRYEISNFGNVRNVKADRFVRCRDNRGGYLCVTFRINVNGEKYQYTFRVHRLVALMFIPNPMNLPEVNHLDCNKRNNRIDNLEWCTRSQNIRHAFKNVKFNLEPARKNALLGAQKVSIKVNQYSRDWKYIQTFNSFSEASRAVGISGNAIKKHCKHKDGYFSFSEYKWRYYDQHPECKDLV